MTKGLAVPLVKPGMTKGLAFPLVKPGMTKALAFPFVILRRAKPDVRIYGIMKSERGGMCRWGA